MKIRDAEHMLFVKVHRSINRLYVLEVEIVVLVCLAMRGSESTCCGTHASGISISQQCASSHGMIWCAVC
jgi:hypothetical protein